MGSVGTNPSLPDSDGDGLLDGNEVGMVTDPMDTDTDGYPDGTDLVKRRGVVYRHQDHLGSTVVVTRSDGQVIQRVVYKPYGAMQSASGSDYSKRLGFYFTGQRYEAAVGIYDYGARFYDPTIGRFLQADNLVPEPYAPQSLNRYSYVLNSPVNGTDPSGNAPDYFDYAGSAYYEEASGQAVRTDWEDSGTSDAGGFGPFASFGGGRPYYQSVSGHRSHRNHNSSHSTNVSIPSEIFSPELTGFGAADGSAQARQPIQVANKAWCDEDPWLPTCQILEGGTFIGGGGGSRGSASAPRALPESRALIPRTFETLAPEGGFLGGFRTSETLRPGTLIDRFGGRRGSYVSPAGTPFELRGLPPETASRPFETFEVLHAIDVEAGIAAPAYGGGFGIQYKLPATVQELIDSGSLGVK